LELAKLAALPDDVMKTARMVSARLSELEEKGQSFETKCSRS